MQNTVHETRHINSRKILSAHCNGMIKNFAMKLGKKEQQCSNFLRENKPVNIGDAIAQQIESTFGYPEKWLDYVVSDDKGITDNSNFEVITLFAELNKAIEHVGLGAYKSNGDVAPLIIYSHSMTAIDKLKRVAASVQVECENTAIDYVSRLVVKELRKDFTVDHETKGVYSDNCFLMLDQTSDITRLKLREMYIFRNYPTVEKIYKCTPVIIDGEYHMFIIKHIDVTQSVSSFKGTNATALRKLKCKSGLVFARSSIPPILTECIDTNPDFNLNNF